MTLIYSGIICCAVAAIGAFVNVGLGVTKEFKRIENDPWGSDDGFRGIFVRQIFIGVLDVLGVVLIAFGGLSLL